MMLDNLSSDSDVEEVEEVESPHLRYLASLLTLPDIENNKAIPKSILDLYHSISQSRLLDFESLCRLPPPLKVKKEVCAKVLKSGDLLVECYDCRFDASCVVCLDCFKGGNHEGHRYVIRNAGGGCCDCGDKEAWKASGFCLQHTGQFKQFQVPQKQLEESKIKLHGLFYMYMYLNMKKHPQRMAYSQGLIKQLIRLNTDNPYYNKITSLCLTCPLLYPLNGILDKCTVLEGVLKFAISGQLIEGWLELFILLFEYYPFKMALLRAYMRGFGELVDGSEGSFRCAGSISCQIMSSHELVERYSQDYGEGLGQDISQSIRLDPHSVKKFKNYYMRMLYDLNYLCKLKGNAPLAYWSMHIGSPTGLSSIFRYYQEIMEFAQSQHSKGVSSTNVIIYLIELASIEEEVISNFALVLNVIKGKEALMVKVLRFLWDNCQRYANTPPEMASIFRPYERCLGLAIFTSFGLALDQVKAGRDQLIRAVFKMEDHEFGSMCIKVLKKLFHTYMLYPKTVSEAGFGQSIYIYLFFYKMKYHFLSSTDIVSIKALLLLASKDRVNFRLDFICKKGPFKEEQSATVRKARVFFNSCLIFLRYLYTFETCEAHVAYQIDPETIQYQFSISNLLMRLFNEKKGCIPIEKMNLFKSSLFSEKVTFINEWLKDNCSVNREKKVFQLNRECGTQGLDFNDLWENNLAEKGAFGDPFKTKEVISGINLEICEMIWPHKEIINLCESVQKLYWPEDNEGVEAVLSNILPIYLIKGKDSEGGRMLLEMVIKPNKEKIPAQIRARFPELSQTKMEDEKDKEETQKLRKQRLEELKRKKLQKMKDTQNRVLENKMEEEEPMLRKLSSHSSHKLVEEEDNETCCICRTDNRETLVYLVKVEMRNNEGLLGLGHGVGCLAFHSCFHTFCHGCIAGSANLNMVYKCPLCKSSSHILLPLDSKADKSVVDSLFTAALNQFHEEELGSAHDYLVRGFYHFILNCYVDPKSLGSRRVRLYQSLADNFVAGVKQPELKGIRQYAFNKYNRTEKNMKKEELKQESNVKIMTRSKRKAIKKEAIKTKQEESQLVKKEEVHEEILESHSFFEVAVDILLAFVGARLHNQILEEEQLERMRKGYPQELLPYATISIIACKVLFRWGLSEEDRDGLAQLAPREYRVVRQLPLRYSELGGRSKCSECGEMSAAMVMCLLCDWTGCQNCPGGISQRHNQQKHGGVVPFMDVQSSLTYFLSEGGISEQGRLYENDWGHVLSKNNKWEEFELNTGRLKEIENTLVYDRPINFRNG